MIATTAFGRVAALAVLVVATSAFSVPQWPTRFRLTISRPPAKR